MTITPYKTKNKKGKVVTRYIVRQSFPNFFIMVTGHTRAYALHNAFKEIRRPF